MMFGIVGRGAGLRRVASGKARLQLYRDGDLLVFMVIAHSKLLPTLGYCFHDGCSGRAATVSVARPQCCYALWPSVLTSARLWWHVILLRQHLTWPPRLSLHGCRWEPQRCEPVRRYRRY
ncbi:hypothetical protein [Mycobacterium uberis]|uniref:hypothetical protein n=1 Tax=Mycobacterium uberis TaxID=2162698 RepID=UPI00140274A4|nr:hypothetical protein [Mycobacterium uberis]